MALWFPANTHEQNRCECLSKFWFVSEIANIHCVCSPKSLSKISLKCYVALLGAKLNCSRSSNSVRSNSFLPVLLQLLRKLVLLRSHMMNSLKLLEVSLCCLHMHIIQINIFVSQAFLQCKPATFITKMVKSQIF